MRSGSFEELLKDYALLDVLCELQVRMEADGSIIVTWKNALDEEIEFEI